MPSLVMYLAIAKIYLEKHSEENEEEFMKGILAPDIKRNLKVEKAKLHYGEQSSHRPDLNRFYQERGLDSSYNRGYFLNLLSDYLFYNKFLQEFSISIFHDFRKMNKRIKEKYKIDLPQELEGRVRFEVGHLSSIEEESVYKFIDSVGQLDLEEYKEQTSNLGERENIKLQGLKEGLLYKQNSSNYFNSHDEEYFYGFENNYGVSVKRVIGYGETDGANEGLYQVSPVGIAVKPSKMFDFDAYNIPDVSERLNQEEKELLLKKCEETLGRHIETNIGFTLLEMTKEETETILRLIRSLKERNCSKEITNSKLNIDLIKIDNIEID
jgi:hypothetical protein